MKKQKEHIVIYKLFSIKNREDLTQIFLKNDVLLLTCVFENFIKVSVKEFGSNPLYCVSLPGYTWQCGLKYTGINLQTLQDKDSILTLENSIRGGISSVMGHRFVKSDENKKILYMDATNIYGYSMSQPLLYYKISMLHGHPDLYMNWLEQISKTPDDCDSGYFIEVDLNFPDNLKGKTKNFPFCPENKSIHKDEYNEYMKKIKPKNYTKAKKLIYDWTDKKNYLVHCRMLNFYVRHGMIVDKVHEIFSFKQSKWFEKYINFITRKRNKANIEFKEDFYNLLNDAFYGKTMGNVRNFLRLHFVKKR